MNPLTVERTQVINWSLGKDPVQEEQQRKQLQRKLQC